MVMIGYVFMCLIFGTTFLAIKIGVDAGIAPFFSAGLRFFIAGLLLFCFLVLRGKAPIGLFLRKEMFFTGIGLTFGTFATLYWAEQYVTSGMAAVLSATGPVMILLLQTFLLKKKAQQTAFFGCVVGILGVFLLILPSISLQMDRFWLIGCLLIIIGEVFYASGTIYSKHVNTTFAGTSPIALNAVQMMHGGLLLLLLSLFTEDIQISKLLSFASAGSLVYLIVFGSMIGHSLYYWLVTRTNPVFPSTWLFISPIIAVFLGVIFYHENLSWISGLGALTIMIGTVFVHLETLKGLEWKLIGGRGRKPITEGIKEKRGI